MYERTLTCGVSHDGNDLTTTKEARLSLRHESQSTRAPSSLRGRLRNKLRNNLQHDKLDDLHLELLSINYAARSELLFQKVAS